MTESLTQKSIWLHGGFQDTQRLWAAHSMWTNVNKLNTYVGDQLGWPPGWGVFVCVYVSVGMWWPLRSGVIRTCTVFLVFGQLKARTALTRHPAFAWSLSADVRAAVLLVHAVHSICSGNKDKGTELWNFCLTAQRTQLTSDHLCRHTPQKEFLEFLYNIRHLWLNKQQSDVKTSLVMIY